jgi:predicted acetyltransferase
MELAFRAATEDDLDRLLELGLAAYPDARVVEERRRSFVANAFGALSDLVVAVDRGTIVGKAWNFPLEGFFGGKRLQIGGIASVAVALEHRQRGIGSALLQHLHVVSDVRGDAVTMLFAYRHRFYERLGYATTSSRKRLAIDARSIPAAWCALAKDRVRSARGEDREAIKRAHLRAAARGSGWIVRPEALWQRLFARERRFVSVIEREGDGLAGYVAFMIGQTEAHAEQVLEVDELVADDPETRCALLGALGAMRDQVAEILIEVEADDPLEQVLLDPDGRRFGTAAVEHSLGEIVGGPMIRIEDFTRAIEARGYSGAGAFDVVIGDELAMSVVVEDGRAEVGPARGGPSVKTTRSGLAAILYGALPASRAVALGLADADPRTAARIDSIAAIPPVFVVDTF